MSWLALRCPVCGPVEIRACNAEIHTNARDGFRLLVAPCPTCRDLVVSSDVSLFTAALGGGATQRELLPPVPPLTADDLLDLHALLADDGWCARLVEGA